MALSAPSGRPKGKQYLQGKMWNQYVITAAASHPLSALPEIYNVVFQNHAQPLFDLFEALLLIHRHCAQPVRPARITPVWVKLRLILTGPITQTDK